MSIVNGGASLPIGLLVALVMSMFLLGCGAHLERSATFTDSSSGEVVKVSVDATHGYDLSYDGSGSFSVTDGNGQEVVRGQVKDASEFDSYKDTIVARTFEGTVRKSTDDTIEWTYSDESGDVEHNKIVRVSDDKAVLMGSTVDEEDAQSAYKAISIGSDG